MKTNIKKNKKNGSVLVTVIMLILAMMALAIGLLSAIGSQGVLGQSEVSRIKAEQLSKGLFWRFYHETNLSGTPTSITSSETLDGRTYTGTVTMGGPVTFNDINASANVINATVVY